MPDNFDDILNNPITADEFKSEDMPADDTADDTIDPSDMDLDIDDDEIDPVGDIDLDSGGVNDSDFDTELNDDDLGLDIEQEPINIAPEEQVRWTVVPQENGDIWSEHVNGFIVRARPLSAQQGSKIKYMAQLFKDRKMLEKGTIWIDANVDPVEYLQNISDRILDRFGFTNVSRMKPKPQESEENNLDLDLGDETGDEADIENELNAGEVENDLNIQ